MRILRGRPLIIWGGGRGADFHEQIFCFRRPSEQFFFFFGGPLDRIFFFVLHHAPQMINGRPLSDFGAEIYRDP